MNFKTILITIVSLTSIILEIIHIDFTSDPSGSIAKICLIIGSVALLLILFGINKEKNIYKDLNFYKCFYIFTLLFYIKNIITYLPFVYVFKPLFEIVISVLLILCLFKLFKNPRWLNTK